MIDVLFIHPGNRLSDSYQSLVNDLTAIEPPLWAAMAAAFLRQKGHSVQIIDAEVSTLSLKDLVNQTEAAAPKLIAIPVYGHHPSASTQMMPAIRLLTRELKATAPELPILLFGGHAAALPEQTLKEETVDFVSTGEGFFTLLDLITHLKHSEFHVKKVRDLVYWEKSKCVRSEARAPLLTDLDQEIGIPAWDLLPMENYRAHNWHCFGGYTRAPYASIYTTLGCPYHCDFCCIQAPFRTGESVSGYSQTVNSYRFFSPQAILKQIDYLYERWRLKNIKIADELFVLNKRHVESICDGLIERNYELNIWAYARVDTIPLDLLTKMKRAGFNWLALGIESADAAVRNGISKEYKQEQIAASIQALEASGTAVIANYIFGLPEDTLASMNATLNLAADLNTEFANFYSAMAYPGSPLYSKNPSLFSSSWTSYSQYATDADSSLCRHLSSEEIIAFRDQAFKKYFDRPEYRSKLTAKFGAESVRQIKEMLTIKIERNHA